MTQSEAHLLDEALRELKTLRTNRFFRDHFLPEIARLRDEHRTAMRDRTLTPEQRTEHISAWEDLQSILEFPDREETRQRERLRVFYHGADTIERPFAASP